MRKNFVAAGLAFCTLVFYPAHATPIHIIPQPLQVTEREGFFHFGRSCKIFISVPDAQSAPGCSRVIRDFADGFFRATGIVLSISQNPFQEEGEHAIVISIRPDSAIHSNEGYKLDITEKKIGIAAVSGAGLFYALESIKQLLPFRFYATKAKKSAKVWEVACIYIFDCPRYPYRGMHLDESRHFFGEKFIKEYLDILARFKINTFHWHLTDSHGWRIEIKKYPRLTSVAAWRADRKDIPMTIAEPTGPGEDATYGGFYTQEQIKEIVQYASDRFITIIPEIEMPGHCDAALVAYPRFNCLNNPIPLLIPCGSPQDLMHNFCVGYDSTFVFLQDILQEIIPLFPAPYIHIGGDEVRTRPWEHCPRCIERMKEEGFVSFRQLQDYFTHRIDSFITAKGKITIGWDEILHAAVFPKAIAMAWHGNAETGEDLQKGHDLVMAPYYFTYFDFYQSDPGLEPDITYAALFLDTAYAFDPLPEGTPAAQVKYILGGEACLWTENITTPQRVCYMLLPRLLALSESLWSYPANKNYSRFIDKVEDACKRFDLEKINYARSMYNVSIRPSFDKAGRLMHVSLVDQTHHYPIHYSTDGSEPTVRSATYTKNITVTKSMRLKTASFRGKIILGKINQDSFSLHAALGAFVTIEAGDTSLPGAGAKLADGIFGTVEPFDNRWLPMHDSIVSVTIRLDHARIIRSVAMRFMEDQVSDIFLPRQIDILLSENGRQFNLVQKISNPQAPLQQLRKAFCFGKKKIGQRARYVKIILRNPKLFLPEPEKNLMLLDEITVD